MRPPVHEYGACRFDDHGLGIELFRGASRQFQSLEAHGADFVDHHDVRHAHVGFAGMVPAGVIGPVWIDHDDQEIRPIERQVVVPAVPDDDVRLLLRLPQDALVVHARVDHGTRPQVGLVLLSLLDRHVVPIQVVRRREPLRHLSPQIAVRHGMPHGYDPFPHRAQDGGDAPTGLALPRAGPRRAHRDHRHGGFEHRLARPQEQKVRTCGHRPRSDVHDVLV